MDSFLSSALSQYIMVHFRMTYTRYEKRYWILNENRISVVFFLHQFLVGIFFLFLTLGFLVFLISYYFVLRANFFLLLCFFNVNKMLLYNIIYVEWKKCVYVTWLPEIEFHLKDNCFLYKAGDFSLLKSSFPIHFGLAHKFLQCFVYLYVKGNASEWKMIYNM